MILAVHLTATPTGNPFSLHCIGVEDSEMVCQIGPALVRPGDWLVPEGMPRSHRECVRWGLPMRALFGAALRMAECADTFVAYDMEVVNFQIKAWCATDKALQSVLGAWTRPGPARVSVSACLPALPVPPTNADELLSAYRIALETGAVAA